VRAAGGVVMRREGGATEVLLVHRPRYDDWGFPKGKVHPGERDEDCALREVEEETGLRCELEDELPATTYRDSQQRPKIVRYWIMRPLAGDAGPRHEVDEVRWVPVAGAAELLSYERDRQVLGAFTALLETA
jgi:8-oxo-dGTP pyrophosphatase MutT (NUDIX family)